MKVMIRPVTKYDAKTHLTVSCDCEEKMKDIGTFKVIARNKYAYFDLGKYIAVSELEAKRQAEKEHQGLLGGLRLEVMKVFR